MAMNTMIRIMARPTTAVRFPVNVRSARWRWEMSLGASGEASVTCPGAPGFATASAIS